MLTVGRPTGTEARRGVTLGQTARMPLVRTRDGLARIAPAHRSAEGATAAAAGEISVRGETVGARSAEGGAAEAGIASATGRFPIPPAAVTAARLRAPRAAEAGRGPAASAAHQAWVVPGAVAEAAEAVAEVAEAAGGGKSTP